MKIKYLYPLLLSSTFLFIACGISQTDESGQILVKNGVKVDADSEIFKTTVGIIKEEDLSKGKTFCTGTIIDSQTILTAAHCLTADAESPRTKTSLLRVAFGERSISPWEIRKIKVQAWHKGFNPDEPTNPLSDTPPNDLGLLRLTEEIPSDFHPTRMGWTSKLEESQAVTIAGYGRAEGTDPSGTLRFAGQKITQIDKERARIETGVRGENNKYGGCPGDSGGPLFKGSNENLILIGVLSTGTNNPFTHSCLAWNSYTDVRSYKTRIVTGIEKLDNATDDVTTF